jgi:hypothetical protein
MRTHLHHQWLPAADTGLNGVKSDVLFFEMNHFLSKESNNGFWSTLFTAGERFYRLPLIVGRCDVLSPTIYLGDGSSPNFHGM